MPEGDTIHRSARRLAQALEGRALTRFAAPRISGKGPAAGAVISKVEAEGKYLLVHFDDGSTLETHMKMTGSWHLYRRGERWRRSARSAMATLETSTWIGVCFSAPHVVWRPAGAARSPGRVQLGPDLCSPDPDFDLLVERVARLAPSTTPVVDVLLDQRLFCGVGNVFKSEVLYACGLHPTLPIGSLSASERRHLAEVAHRQLRENLDGGPRATVPGGLAVYGRGGDPCRTCRTPIEWARHGPHARSTYWCPTCQPAPGRTAPDS